MTTGENLGLSIVVPVYKCRETLRPLADRIARTLEEMGMTFEIVMVDDGCPHGSWEEIENLVRQKPFVKGIKLARNCGQAAATAAGVNEASGKYVIVMDGDLQDPPEAIPRFYRCALMNGFEIVFGERHRRDHGFIRDFISKAYSIAASLGVMPQLNQYGSFTLMTRKAAAEYLATAEKNCVFIMVLMRLEMPKGEVNYEQQKREIGRHSYSLFRLLKLLALRLFIRENPLVSLFVAALISLTIGFAAMILGHSWLFFALAPLLPLWGLIEAGATIFRKTNMRVVPNVTLRLQPGGLEG